MRRCGGAPGSRWKRESSNLLPFMKAADQHGTMTSKAPSPVEIDAVDARGAGIRVVFDWRGDRYGHAIFGVFKSEMVHLLNSVEGDEHAPWPPSPPLQQFQRHEHPPSAAALLLTGMAGRSHWSASLTTESDMRWARTQFEIACRYRERPNWLGVTYRVAEGIAVAQNPERGSVILSTVSNGLQYELHALPIPVSIATEWIPTSSVTWSGNSLQIAAVQTPHMSTDSNTRWAYSLDFTRPYWME